jgi:hypothetical protein
MTQCPSLGLASRRGHPNVGALHGISAALEELEVRQTEWVDGVLLTFALDNPVHKRKQVFSEATGTEASFFRVFSAVWFQLF